jgi:hypothetical protein
MPYWPPDSAPEVPPQMPQAGAGPAPVPYGGPGFAIAPVMLAPAPDVPAGLAPGAGVLNTVTGANHVTEAAPVAPDVGPHAAGEPSPIAFPADPDPGGRDIVSGSVAGAVAAAQARYGELQGDTYALGSHIGDLMALPPSPLDPGAGPGLTDPAGHYYTPPRDYGDEPA